MRLPAALFVAVVAVLAAGLRERPAAAPQEARYNVISIVTDDQAEWSVGAYGNRESRTPHMDRLAREGARFLNAFVPTPVCSPSRASFLTGLYGTQVGITDWISPQQAARGLGLESKFVTWPEVLQQHGYRTALLGKWHLGMQPQFHPTKRGFDHFYGFLGGGNTPVNPTLEVSGREQQVEGPLPDRLADEAIGFVKGNRDRPFALLLHFRAPHLPYGPVPPEDAAPFEGLDPAVPTLPGLDIPHVKRLTREYYASVHSVDRNIGRLLAALDELDLTRRTIVVFTSDHGYMIGHHLLHAKGNGFWIAGGVNGPKRPNMFEESIRVPLLVRWPGVVQPGTEVREMVSGIDTFPSVLAMLGVQAPASVRHEGRDFSPLLRGARPAWRDRVFGQYDLHNGGLAHMRMVRTDRWKLVRHHFSSGLDELYDLQADPGESRNLYNREEARAIRDELQQSLSSWQRGIGDPILESGNSPGRGGPAVVVQHDGHGARIAAPPDRVHPDAGRSQPVREVEAIGAGLHALLARSEERPGTIDPDVGRAHDILQHLPGRHCPGIPLRSLWRKRFSVDAPRQAAREPEDGEILPRESDCQFLVGPQSAPYIELARRRLAAEGSVKEAIGCHAVFARVVVIAGIS